MVSPKADRKMVYVLFIQKGWLTSASTCNEDHHGFAFFDMMYKDALQKYHICLVRPAVGPSYGLFVEPSAKPIDNPARPHWPLPTVYATRAQDQTEDQHETVFSFIENPNFFPT